MNTVHPMLEVAKFVGAMVWIVGFIFVFIFPPVGFFILLVALLISIATASRTRELRHQEIVSLAGKGPLVTRPPTPSSPPKPSVSDRLGELDKLRETGVISDEEHQAKRQKILDEI